MIPISLRLCRYHWKRRGPRRLNSSRCRQDSDQLESAVYDKRMIQSEFMLPPEGRGKNGENGGSEADGRAVVDCVLVSVNHGLLPGFNTSKLDTYLA